MQRLRRRLPVPLALGTQLGLATQLRFRFGHSGDNRANTTTTDSDKHRVTRALNVTKNWP